MCVKNEKKKLLAIINTWHTLNCVFVTDLNKNYAILSISLTKDWSTLEGDSWFRRNKPKVSKIWSAFKYIKMFMEQSFPVTLQKPLHIYKFECNSGHNVSKLHNVFKLLKEIKNCNFLLTKVVKNETHTIQSNTIQYNITHYNAFQMLCRTFTYIEDQLVQILSSRSNKSALFTQISWLIQIQNTWMGPEWACTGLLSGKPACCTHSCSLTQAQSTPHQVSGSTGPRQSSYVVSKWHRPRYPPWQCLEYPLNAECAGSLQLPRQQDPGG